MISYPQFPAFERLTTADRDRFETLTAPYPQFSDICLSSLLIWWNFTSQAAFSTLSGNLVLRYEFPDVPDGSGYCLVGHHDVQGSIEILLDHLVSSGEAARLVHVPEFTIEHLHDRERTLQLSPERDWAEYIIDSQMLADLEGPEIGRIRRKVNRCLRELRGRQVTLTELDLADVDVVDDLVEHIYRWNHSNGTRNADPDEYGTATAIRNTVSIAQQMKISNVALQVDGDLFGFALFSVTQDQRYLILHHLKANYRLPFVFDYLTHIVATRAQELDVPRINMEMDLGIESLRNHKMALRPIEFLNKYTVSRAVRCSGVPVLDAAGPQQLPEPG